MVKAMALKAFYKIKSGCRVLKYFFMMLIISNLCQASVAAFRLEGKNLRQGMQSWHSDFEQKKAAVLMFISATCPCSQSYFAYLNKLQKEFPQFQFVAIHSNKNLATALAQTYLNKFEMDYPVLDDAQLEMANRFQALKTPHIFLVNKEGKVLFQGAATDSRNPEKAQVFYLKNALTAVSEGKEIEIKEAKTLGCYIER